MKECPKSLKTWLDASEKIAIIFTLMITVLKGCGYITEKIEQSKMLNKETEKRTAAVDILTDTYVSQLKTIDEDIRELDKAIEKEPWATTTGAENKYRIREEKVKDKQELLKNLGNQIIELQKCSVNK